MDELQVKALLEVFKSLDLEKRQALIPQLVEIAGIITRENVKHLNKEEKNFAEFLFNQTFRSRFTRQYMNKCSDIILDIKNRTGAGKIKEYNLEYIFYLELNVSSKFTNTVTQDIDKDQFFDFLFTHENNTFKTVYIVENSERRLLGCLLDF